MFDLIYHCWTTNYTLWCSQGFQKTCFDIKPIVKESSTRRPTQISSCLRSELRGSCLSECRICSFCSVSIAAHHFDLCQRANTEL